MTKTEGGAVTKAWLSFFENMEYGPISYTIVIAEEDGKNCLKTKERAARNMQYYLPFHGFGQSTARL